MGAYASASRILCLPFAGAELCCRLNTIGKLPLGTEVFIDGTAERLKTEYSMHVSQ